MSLTSNDRPVMVCSGSRLGGWQPHPPDLPAPGRIGWYPSYAGAADREKMGVWPLVADLAGPPGALLFAGDWSDPMG